MNIDKISMDYDEALSKLLFILNFKTFKIKIQWVTILIIILGMSRNKKVHIPAMKSNAAKFWWETFPNFNETKLNGKSSV